MDALVIGFVVGLVFALWMSIGVRVVRGVLDRDGAVRAETERGLRDLQSYLAHR